MIKKLLLRFKGAYSRSLIILFLLVSIGVLAQAPSISYTTPLALTKGASVSVSPVNSGGVAVKTWVTSTLASNLMFPSDVTVDASGNVYVLDTPDNKLYKISVDGTLSVYAGTGVIGSMDGNRLSATFKQPGGIAIDAAGNLYIADSGNSLIRKITTDGTVSTIAGTGVDGYMDGSAATASFKSPTDLDLDKNGNIYVVDAGNNVIRKISSDLTTVSTFAGNGTAATVDGTGTAASFNHPSCITIDRKYNDMYVTENSGNTIRSVSITNASVLTHSGTGSAGYADGKKMVAQFDYPGGITYLAPYLYVVDRNNNAIRRVTEDEGTATTIAGALRSIGSTDGATNLSQFNFPFGICADASGNLYVGDSGNGLVRKISQQDAYTISPALPEGLSFDATSGTISGVPTTVTPSADYTVRAVNADGEFNTKISISVVSGIAAPVIDYSPSSVHYSVGQTVSGFTPSNMGGTVSSDFEVSTFAGGNTSQVVYPNLGYPYGMARDASGNLYVADNDNNVIYKVNSTGTISVFAGIPGSYGLVNGAGVSAQFRTLTGLVIYGNTLFVCDNGNSCIRAIDLSTASVTTFAGNGTKGNADGQGTAARFRSPLSITADVSGNLYVADGGNHNIRKITPAGQVTTIAGSTASAGGEYGNADGIGSAARFNTPAGTVADANGNLYVADQYNYTIRKIDLSSGSVITLAGNETSASVDGIGKAASFSLPFGLAVDASGVLYVADRDAHAIRKVNPFTGVVSTLSGTTTPGLVDGSISSAQFYRPASLLFDADDNLYVVDAMNAAIRKIVQKGGYKVSPVLPYGLTLNFSTGEISGLPQKASSTATYSVSATNDGGTGSTVVSIEVTVPPTPSIIYNFANVTTSKGSSIATLTPTNDGGVATYSVSPALPAGLVMDVTTGVISGIPTVAVSAKTYTVTATNVSGTSIYDITIAVDDIAPTGLAYSGATTFIKGSSISALSPSYSAVGGTPTLYSINPSLPDGLLLDPTTGIISGTPVSISASQDYTITASNSFGSTSVIVSISINDAAPASIAYSGSTAFSKGTTITPLTPSITGGTPTIFSVSPVLPSGLTLDASTGSISGTPTAVSAATNYTVTASNQTGSASVSLSITVANSKPNISYTTPLVFTVGTAIAEQLPVNTGGDVEAGGAQVSTFAGSGDQSVIDGVGVAASFYQPWNITSDPSGNLYVSEPQKSIIRKITPDGVVSVFAGTKGTSGYADGIGTAAKFDRMQGMCSDADGNIYVADINNNRIRKITPSGVVSTFAGSGDNSAEPGDLQTSGFYSPIDLAFSPDYNYLYVAELYGQCIGRINMTTGTVDILAGSNAAQTGNVDGLGISARFNYPSFLTTDAFGNIYVCDQQNYKIRKITPAGVVTTLAGSGTSMLVDGTGSSASFEYPAGIAYDKNNNVLYVSEYRSQIIRQVTLSGVVTSFAGIKNASGSIDGDLSTAKFSYPLGLCLNQSGNLFVTEVGTKKIRKIAQSKGGYTISPSLPSGLSFDTSSGAINGTPLQFSQATDYTVNATNSIGIGSTTVNITVVDIAPSDLSYTGATTFTKGVSISSLIPTVSGGAVTNYSVTPSLPSGLTLDPVTGVITGTPTDITPSAAYTVTASNTGGSTTVQLTLGVNDESPSGLYYTGSTTFTKGVSISSLAPTVSGGTVTNYSVTPSLPSGLTLDPVTGVITGTPTDITPSAAYTVTASNTGGSTTVQLTLGVNDESPSTLTYRSPMEFWTGKSITPQVPSNKGGVITAYSISPSLPTGLLLDANTGFISGTPTEVVYGKRYKITGSNTGGETDTEVMITVKDGTPIVISLTNGTSSAPVVACENSGFDILFNSVSGNPAQYKITYSATALEAGMTSVDYTAIPSMGYLNVIVPKGTKFGTYSGVLRLKNVDGVESEEYPFVFTVNVSVDYVVKKFEDVILCDNSTNQFTSYQWYKNGLPISGATQQFYCDPLGILGTYSVKLTTVSGSIVHTCDKTYATSGELSKIKVYPSEVNAGASFNIDIIGIEAKNMQQSVLSIYSMNGGILYQAKGLSYANVVHTSVVMKGMCVGNLVTAEGHSYTFKIVVK